MTAIPTPRFDEALVTHEPTSEYPERMKRFGRLVGSWSVKGSRLSEETGDWSERTFVWEMAFILDGRAVQDVEIEAREEHPTGFETVATAIRVYDAFAGVWRVSYFAPVTGEYCHLVATPYRYGIRQDGTRTDGKLIRWNFTSITANSYKWEGWVSNDEGSSWQLIEHNEATRIR
ncbi:hypothetical protein GY21_08860 [Cryobacterium roopkundense]|uniref:DUF1579 domain-containing protein n=1 Tax=Cryobacterium roopkundense TaxID=1001240 RepID=A0A099JHG5_9MICO|nr:hypothetical protein [Cryobacterium roopkundense]KGJ76938.1 hypothetical protein GY21_08860 [Cryobacterium roopkundense]MBB5643182.1 hypothetical protein [Cryobacterium roopkundense]